MTKNLKKHDTHTASMPTYFWVYGILTLWGENNRQKKLPINEVYKAFQLLVVENPRVFRNVDFESFADKALSPEIEEILFLLGVGGVVSTANPRYKYLQIDRGSTAAKSKIIELGGQKAWDKVRKIVDRFSDLVCNAAVEVTP